MGCLHGWKNEEIQNLYGRDDMRICTQCDHLSYSDGIMICDLLNPNFNFVKNDKKESEVDVKSETT